MAPFDGSVHGKTICYLSLGSISADALLNCIYLQYIPNVQAGGEGGKEKLNCFHITFQYHLRGDAL